MSTNRHSGRSQASCSADPILTYTHSSQLSGCKTFTGDIAAPTDRNALSSGSTIERDVETILGHVGLSGSPDLTAIKFPKLKTVDGLLSIENNPMLSSISMGELSLVKLIQLTNLTRPFDEFVIGTQLQTPDLSISSTSLSSLDGLSLDESIDNLEIRDNYNLSSINLNVVGVDGSLFLLNNASPTIISLPRLRTAGDVSLSRLSELHLPVLNSTGRFSVNDSPELHYLYVDALIEIKSPNASATLSILGNPQLSNISFPALQEVGDVIFTKNPALMEINLARLDVVQGDFTITSGNFTSFPMNELIAVKGSIDIESNANISKLCDSLNTRQNSSLSALSINCQTSVSRQLTSPSGPMNDTSNPASSPLTPGAKAGIGIGVGLGALVLAAILYFLMLPRRKNNLDAMKYQGAVNKSGQPSIAELPVSHTSFHELNEKKEHVEVGRSTSTRMVGVENRHEVGDQTAHELYGDIGNEMAGDHAHEMDAKGCSDDH